MKGQMSIMAKKAEQTTAVVGRDGSDNVAAGITDNDLLPSGTVLDPQYVPATEQIADPRTDQASEKTGNASGSVMMSAADIAEIVRAATSAVAAAGNQAIADAISKALTQHMGPRRITAAELGEPKTPFNPRGVKRELKCEFFQNSAPIMERFVSDDEIEMLHRLTPGSYGTPDLPIAVVVKKRLDGKDRVYIIHPDGKDDRLRMKNYAPNFHTLLVKLEQEAKAQRAQRRAEARALLADTDE